MNISDEKLFQLCQFYGRKAREWRQKFAGLLPEVFRRGLYKKKGFTSIFEFAAKLAGMNEEQTSLVLNLHKRFEDKPILKNILENGEVSVNKLARVASVATRENEEFWADKVKLLPKSALETLVKDDKNARSTQGDLQNVHFNELFMPGHEPENILPNKQGLRLSVDVTEKLLELQKKGIDINQLLLEFLEKRELEISQKKEELSQNTEVTNSRYIPASIRKILNQEYGTKCSIAMCAKDAVEIHHSQRFSLSRKHDPKYLAPLCKEHHRIAHAIDVKTTMLSLQHGP